MHDEYNEIWENYKRTHDKVITEHARTGRGADTTGIYSVAGGKNDDPTSMGYDDVKTPGEVASRIGGNPNPSSSPETPFTMRSDQAGFSLGFDRTATYYLNPMLITWWPSGTKPGFEIVVHKGKLISRVGWFTQDELSDAKQNDPKAFAKDSLEKRFGIKKADKGDNE